MSATLQNIYAPSPFTTRGKSVVISGDPKGVNFLYTCGNAVIIRNLKNPITADIYYEHPAQATVAKYAPSGFYIASGDVQGNLRIWDTTQKEHPLKIELKVLSGSVLDLAWSPDSQRLVIVGDGKERFGAAILWDSGASVGEISGHSKPISSCDFKSSRPFRVITGSEDFQSNWFEGPPFKFKQAFKEHTRFVNCVRFSPDGNKALTVGSDKKGFFLDGKTGEKIGQLGDNEAHALGIYACSWSPDGKKVLTVSADKTAKIWDETGKLQTTFTFEGGVEAQQLGCLWQGETIASVNLGGDISILDPANPNKPHVIKGHNKLITALAFDPKGNHLYSGSYDATILQWDPATGHAHPIEGTGHSSSITAMAVSGTSLVTISVDDTVRITPFADRKYTSEAIKLDSQPQAVAAGTKSDVIVVGTLASVVLIRGGKIVQTIPAAWTATAVAISADENEVAVGGKDNKIHIFDLSGNALKENKVLEKHRGFLTAISYSPDGKHFASADQNRDIFVWDKSSKECKTQGWVFHNARVTSLAWSASSKHIVTGSLDHSIIVWNVEDTGKRIQVKSVHPGGVNAVLWIDANTVASAGLDCAIKTHTIKF